MPPYHVARRHDALVVPRRDVIQFPNEGLHGPVVTDVISPAFVIVTHDYSPFMYLTQ